MSQRQNGGNDGQFSPDRHDRLHQFGAVGNGTRIHDRREQGGGQGASCKNWPDPAAHPRWERGRCAGGRADNDGGGNCRGQHIAYRRVLFQKVPTGRNQQRRQDQGNQKYHNLPRF